MTLQLRPTFSESWYRVAPLRAKLRASAQISRQYYRGERWYVVRDPAGNQFHRLSDAAYRLVGLIDADVTPDATVLLRRHKKQQQRKMQGRLMNVLFPRIPLWDPDRFLKRWMPIVRHLMSPIGAIIWLIVVVAAVVMIIPQWGE